MAATSIVRASRSTLLHNVDGSSRRLSVDSVDPARRGIVQACTEGSDFSFMPIGRRLARLGAAAVSV
eukprot:CAMPEP_0115841850 /NCGR_PEP_ID=MMETSP0287-20121206/7501_1 /TAXON_ID=412157 /ORGANISM="Chrysochromulina rotalis, Strain UIO044" /LENGTH=66 /DNA_ID=CAMNT_0003295509 /DNA_START=170 /DNA_END=370 /DNA_ORIENTATION=-